jgi:hypothetical protein
MQAQGRNITYLANRPLVGVLEPYRATLESYAVSGMPGGQSTPIPFTPIGPIDGANKIFTLPITSTQDISLMLFLDGVFQVQGVDYTFSGVTITYATAPRSGGHQIALVLYGLGTPNSEVPDGTIDGANTQFTLEEVPQISSNLLLFLDGIYQTQGIDYTLSGNSINY